jgi:pyruvate formate lyase activating enzyme
VKSARTATSEAGPAALLIGGFEPFSTLDLPGEIAAVVFCQGCKWRCGYCHNPHLIAETGEHIVAWTEVRARLARRVRFLDGVVFSGGEPLRQARALAAAMGEVRDMGYRVGLQTNGSDPAALASVLPLTDWVGIDVKAPPALYERVTGLRASGALAWESVGLVARSGVAYEFRTTVDPRVLDAHAVIDIGLRLNRLGVERYVLQEMRGANMLSDEPVAQAASERVLLAAADGLLGIIPRVELRRV